MDNICLFIRSLANGGAENQAIILADKLSKSNKTMLVVLYEHGNLVNRAKAILGENNLCFMRGNNIIHKCLKLFIFLRKNNTKILICYLPVNNIIGIIIGKLAGVPIIFGGLRGSNIKKCKLKMFIQKILMNKFSTAVISNSYKARKTYSEFGVKKEKIYVIHNSLDVNIKPLIRKHKNVVRILSVGRFVEEKDYLTSLRSIKLLIDTKLLDNSVSFKYNIVGYGKLETLVREYINQLELSDHVDLITNCFEIDNIYQESDIFLLTSRYEGMPNVIMEAMNWSLPVVTTNAGDASYLVRNNETGFICPVGDFNEIANKLYLLVVSRQLRLVMGLRGYKVLNDNYASETMFNKYHKLIDIYGSKRV